MYKYIVSFVFKIFGMYDYNIYLWEKIKYMDDKLFIDIALRISKESKCQSLQVGAVIVKDNRVISMGINGTPNGFVNCNTVNFNDSALKKHVSDYTTTNVNMNHTEWSMIHEIHAEMNAILYAAKKGIQIEDATMYVTHEPCDQCLKNIIQSGITRVVYLNEYNGNVTIDSEYRKNCCTYINLDRFIDVKLNGFILTPKNSDPVNVNYTRNIDQHKANIATCYIGFGAEGTSTYNYMKDAESCNLKVNSKEYTKDDVVFVSVNGEFRYDRCDETVNLCINALNSGAMIVLDSNENRELAYNNGERYVLQSLNQYYEKKGITLIGNFFKHYNIYKLNI